MIKKITIIMVLMIISLILYACNVNTTKILQSRLSYIEKCKLFGETEDFRIVVTVGIKEITPIIDGIKGETEDFTKIVLIPLKLGGLEKRYSLNYGGAEMAMHPDAIRYQHGITLDGNRIHNEIAILSDGESLSVSLKDVNDSDISYLEALEISAKALQPMLRENIKGKNFDREIYITIVEDTLGRGNFYYYVGYLGANSIYSATLINPYTRVAEAVKP